MKKFSIIFLILFLIAFTAIIKNSTKRIDDMIFVSEEIIRDLKKLLSQATKGKLKYQAKGSVPGAIADALVDEIAGKIPGFAAAKSLLERCGAVVVACAVVIELKALQGRKAVGLPIISLQSYD